MFKLINDVMQYSDAPDTIKTPSLADLYDSTTIPVITLDAVYTIDCIGVGNTDATEIIINGETITLGAGKNKSGLYKLVTPFDSATITITYDGTYIGRIGIGEYRYIGETYTRSIGFYTTAEPRITASGNIIAGAGGITGRVTSLELGYKINNNTIADIESAYDTQISRGFPFFMLFGESTTRQPWTRLYATTDNNLLFESALDRFLYGTTLEYRERF